jgi:hypothetical protein
MTNKYNGCEFCGLHYLKKYMNNICHTCLINENREELEQLRKENKRLTEIIRVLK